LGYRKAASAMILDFGIQQIAPSVLSWILLGLIAGVIASKIVNKNGDSAILDIVLGILGALVGGYVFNTFGEVGVTSACSWRQLLQSPSSSSITPCYGSPAGDSRAPSAPMSTAASSIVSD
jgi:uncharacterized membrane protein YeaQ/YmgE (transglycosylase-associated protein family)